MPNLCLNMIVRNEADRIERCLSSVAPYLSYWVIHDTGSTDDTVVRIEKFFEGRGIPGYVTHGKFTDFSQARNEALENARLAPYPWEYLLLCDADMELVVEDPSFKTQLTGSAHHVVQRGSGTTYHNTRFVHRATTGKYIGVTHEYLDIPTAPGEIKGIWYNDHADGSNRSNKARRDIRLLRGDLDKNPKNARSWFYLANSYKDTGQYQQAIKAYEKVVELGSWDEEVWYSLYQSAHCYAALGSKKLFVAGLLEAHNRRPHRAEAIFDLAHYYREKGMNHASLAFSEEGLRTAKKGDFLFVQDFPYETGLREEFAICGYYDPARRERAYDMTNELSLDPKIPWANRDLATRNLFYYVKPLCESIPSFNTRRIPFAPEDGFTPMNPSVEVLNDQIYCVVRTVNYTMDEAGRYLIKGTNGEANGTNPINTHNYLVKLRSNFEVEQADLLLPPEGFPPPAYDLVIGFEDTRLFAWRGGLWTISNVREQNPDGWCEQNLAKIETRWNDSTFGKTYAYGRTKTIIPVGPKQHEKNWAALVTNSGHDLEFVYRIGQYLQPDSGTIAKTKIPYAVDTLSGGSQYIPFQSGYLAVIHEAHVSPDTGKRYYTHRFVFLDKHKAFVRISKPFVFHNKVIEFAAGMAWHPDGKRIMISYGREDKEAWIATVDPDDVREFIWNG